MIGRKNGHEEYGNKRENNTIAEDLNNTERHSHGDRRRVDRPRARHTSRRE